MFSLARALSRVSTPGIKWTAPSFIRSATACCFSLYRVFQLDSCASRAGNSVVIWLRSAVES